MTMCGFAVKGRRRYARGLADALVVVVFGCLLVAWSDRSLAEEVVEFTPEDGETSFEVPDGVSEITVEVWGGGGKGGDTAGNNETAGGGGAGGYARGTISVASGEEFDLQAGEGGDDIVVDGGESSFDNDRLAAGGGAGVGLNTAAGGGGGSGEFSAGAVDGGVAEDGADGGTGSTGAGGSGGDGGNAPDGLDIGGGAGGLGGNDSDGDAANEPGGGGGGGHNAPGGGQIGDDPRSGGAGAGGLVRITYEEPDPSLRFVQQPSDTREGEEIDPPVTVEVVDTDGNRIDGATDDITLAIASDPSGGEATLSGSVSQNAEEGLATFDDLSLDEPAEDYTLEATADDALPEESEPFTVFDDDLVRIRGRVEQLGAGREGINIGVTGQDDVVTDTTGGYSVFVDPDSSVTLTPDDDDLIFCPQEREVSVGEADQEGVGFQAFPEDDEPADAGTGGDSIYTADGDVVHVFCSTEDAQFVPPANIGEVEVLVVAGGGGGGAPLHFSSAGGGGGGAGGVVQRDAYEVDGAVNLTVGAGGLPGDNPGSPSSGEEGGDSVFADLTAIGGGGGSGDNESGGDGGSGGGSRGEPGSDALQPDSDSEGFGHRGGVHIDTGRDPGVDRAATGGGGAGDPGEDLDGEPGEDGGFGGDGLAFSTVGASVLYAGGGGGGAADFGDNEAGDPGAGGLGGGGRGGRTDLLSVPGFPATGGGGGGGNNSVAGAEGGSGIVVVRYPRTLPDPVLDLRMEELDWNDEPPRDSSEFGNDGSTVGEPNTAFDDPAIEGDPGTCRYGVFDGANDYIEVPHDESLEASANDEVTVTAWVNQQADQTGNDWIALVQKSDASYNLQLENGNIPTFTIHDGVHNVANSADITLDEDRWYHLAGTYDGNTVQLYVDGQLVATETAPGPISDASGSNVGIGENLQMNGRHFNGFMDEVRIYTEGLSTDQINAIRNTTRPCGVTPVDHIRMDHPGNGVTCSPQEIELRACANAECSALVDDLVEVDLTSPAGNWSDDSITIPEQETATVELQVPSPDDVTLDAEAVNPAAENPTRCFVGSDETCVMSWADSGFLIDVEDHVAAEVQSTSVEAVRTDDETLQCTPGFENETKTVEFSSLYNNPDSGNRSIEVEGEAIPVNEEEAQSVDLDFDADGVAPISLVYSDVGDVRLDLLFEGQDELEQDLVMEGGAQLITRPDTFDLDIADLDGANDADGPVFTVAGETFSIAVNARNADGDLTPNFGREDDPEAVELEHTLVAPDGGNNPSFSGDFSAFGESCEDVDVEDGQACGDFSWPEVGIIALTPQLASGAYLGTDNVIGESVDDVGRFIPDRFDVDVIDSGAIESFCGEEGREFAYSGQDLEWAIRPEMQVTALNAAGVVTNNYTQGDFRRLSADDIDRAAPTADSTEENLEGELYPVTSDQNELMLTDAEDGVMVFRYDTEDTVVYDKTVESRIDPFVPDLDFETSSVEDEDEVQAPDLPDTFSPEAGFDLFYGRLRLDNAFGPETLDLIVPMRAEYWEGGRFRLNVDEGGDECWEYNTEDDVTIIEERLSGGSTSVVPVEDTLVAGEPMEGSELELTAPGEGNTGQVDLEFSVPIWLQDDFDGDGELQNPTATATFGVYRGHDRIIHWREVR